MLSGTFNSCKLYYSLKHLGLFPNPIVLCADSLTRILSAPIYAEVSGQYMTYINDFAYLTVAMQHPEDDPEDTIVSMPDAACCGSLQPRIWCAASSLPHMSSYGKGPQGTPLVAGSPQLHLVLASSFVTRILSQPLHPTLFAQYPQEWH